MDQEFLEQTREYASFLLKDLSFAADLVQNPEIVEMGKAFAEKIALWARVSRENLLSAYENMAVLPPRKSLEEAYKMHEKMWGYQGILCLVKQAVDQRFHGHVAEKIHFFEPTKEECAGSKVYKAIDNFVTYLIASFFPSYVVTDSCSIVVFTSVPGYQVWMPAGIPPVAIVQVPEIDLHRCRYWTCLGHEIAHQRYNAYPIFSVDGSGDIYEELKVEMVRDLANLGLRAYGASLENLALAQFQEVLCDLSAVMLLGPSDLLTLITTIANPRLEGTGLSQHPPLAARVEYELEYLDRKTQSVGNGVLSQRLKEWRSSWYYLERLIKRPVRERTYINGFNEIISRYYDDLLTVARDFLEVPETGLFKPETWDKAENLVCGGDEPEGTDYSYVLSLAWAKRWKVFQKVFQGSVTEFFTYHEFERKITYDVINKFCGGE